MCPPISLDALIYDSEIDAAVDPQVVDETEVNNELAALSDELGEAFEVSAQIGKGGMATVYKVFDKRLDKTFAFKVFRDEGNSEVMKRRFEKEAKAVSDLTHVNIATVFGHGETTKGRRYIALDWIDGKPLSELIEEASRLPVDRSLDIFIQLCEALQHAHMKGVVHRDLKPSNIMVRVDENGHEIVKVIDFGVASILQVTDTNSTNLTQTGDVFGTPLYMSPEQCRGDEVDRRSDIYSLGCVMYEALTGSPPFPGKNAVKVVISHLKERPTALPQNVPKELAIVIMQCLEKSQEDRFQTVDEVLQDLIAVRDGRNPSYLRCGRPHMLRRIASSAVDGLIVALPYMMFCAASGVAFNASAAFYLMFAKMALFALIPVAMLWGPGFAVCSILCLCSAVYVISGHVTGPYSVAIILSALVYSSVALVAYHSVLESSAWMATIGQRCFGLAVADNVMKRLSFRAALKRILFKWCHLSVAMIQADMNMMANVSKSSIQEMKRWMRVNWEAICGGGWEDWIGSYIVDRKLLRLPVQPKRRQLSDFSEMSLSQLSRGIVALKAAVLSFGSLWIIAFLSVFLPMILSGGLILIWIAAGFLSAVVFGTFVPALAFYLRARRILNSRLQKRKLIQSESDKQSVS